jgi:uncharacterized protein YcfL
MKWLFVFLLALSLVGCSNKEEETDKQRQEKVDKMYKTPPPSDRSKDKGY